MKNRILVLVLCLFSTFGFADNKMSCVKNEVVYKSKGETFVLYTTEDTSKELKKSFCNGDGILIQGKRISVSRLEAGQVSDGDKHTLKYRDVKLDGNNQFSLFLISKKYKGKVYDNCDVISSKAYSCG